MDKEGMLTQKEHSLTLHKRAKLEMDGVVDVLGFDGTAVDLETTMGVLAVEGEGLRIVNMSKETGKIFIEGTVDSLFYYKSSNKKSGALSKKKGK